MLTPKQKRFVGEYLVDLNGTQAAIRAGYSVKGASVQASLLLANPKVAELISEATRLRAEKVGVKAEDVLRELLRIGLADIGKAFNSEGGLLPFHEMPEDVRRSISGVDVDELWGSDGDSRIQIGTTKKVRFWDKTRGLEMLGKHLKLFTDKLDLAGGVNLDIHIGRTVRK